MKDGKVKIYCSKVSKQRDHNIEQKKENKKKRGRIKEINQREVRDGERQRGAALVLNIYG